MFAFPPQPMACCPDCGQWAPGQELDDGLHLCEPEHLVEFQVSRARRDLVRLEWELACYLATPRARKLLAFRRYLDERDRDARQAA